MDERRKFPRFKAGVEVEWKKLAAERMAQHISHLKDVSQGGVCLVVDANVESGDILEVQVRLPNKPLAIRTRAKVIWVNRQARVPGWKDTVCEGGVEFLDVGESIRKEISHYITSTFYSSSHK